MNILSLEGKNILVTGASSGIGKATSVLFSKLGAKVILNGRDENRLDSTFQLMEKNDHKIVQWDISDIRSIPKFMKEVCSDRKLDGMVHSAGISYSSPLSSTSYEFMFKIMNINYFAYIELIKQYSKKANNNGGSIVGISSVSAHRGFKALACYAGSKGAVEASTRVIANEMIKKGIRINCVAPGLVSTDMIEHGIVDLHKVEGQSLGLIEPDNVAGLIAYLMSDISCYSNGRTFHIDGGLLQ